MSHWPRIPTAWTVWRFAGRLYRLMPDGRVLVRRTPRHAWTVSAWPRG